MKMSLKSARETLKIFEKEHEKNPHDKAVVNAIFQLRKLIKKLEAEQDARARFASDMATERSDRVSRQAAIVSVLDRARRAGVVVTLAMDSGWGEIGGAMSAVSIAESRAETQALLKTLFPPTALYAQSSEKFKTSVRKWRENLDEQADERGSTGQSGQSGMALKIAKPKRI